MNYRMTLRLASVLVVGAMCPAAVSRGADPPASAQARPATATPEAQPGFDPVAWVRTQLALASAQPPNREAGQFVEEARASFRPETARRLETEPWIEAWAFASGVGDIVVARGVLRDAYVAVCGDRRPGREVSVVRRGQGGEVEVSEGYQAELVTLSVSPDEPAILLGLDNVRDRTWIVRPKGGCPVVVPMEGEVEIELEVRRPEKLAPGESAILEFWTDRRPADPPALAVPDEPGVIAAHRWPVPVAGQNTSRCDRAWFRSLPLCMFAFQRGNWLPMADGWFVLVADWALAIPPVIEPPEIDGDVGWSPYAKVSSEPRAGSWKVHRRRGPASIRLAAPDRDVAPSWLQTSSLYVHLAHDASVLYAAVFLPRGEPFPEAALEFIVDARDLPQCGKVAQEGWDRRYTLKPANPEDLSRMPVGTRVARADNFGADVLEMAIPLEPMLGRSIAAGQLFALGIRLLQSEQGPPMAVFPDDLPPDFGPADLIYFRLGLAPGSVLHLP